MNSIFTSLFLIEDSNFMNMLYIHNSYNELLCKFGSFVIKTFELMIYTMILNVCV